MAYGFAINNPFVWVPNGVGAILGVVQLILYVAFQPKKR